MKEVTTRVVDQATTVKSQGTLGKLDSRERTGVCSGKSHLLYDMEVEFQEGETQLQVL